MATTPPTRRTVRLAAIAASVAMLGCQAPFNDPLETGLRLSPIPGETEGPVDLRVENATGLTLACVVHELDVCPSLGDVVDELTELTPEERWEVTEVTCAALDVACWPDPIDPTEAPLRAWGWSIVPPDEEDAP